MRQACFALRIEPVWEMIDPVREFLLRFLSDTLKDEALGAQVCVAAHELMENAVKYSQEDWIAVETTLQPGRLMVAVENPAHPAHLPVLLAEVRAAQAAPDPMAYLQQKIRAACERQDGKSCVGLARVRCEAGMSLDCQVRGGVVRVVALRDVAWT